MTVVNEALTQVFADMGTVMIGLNISGNTLLGLVGVDMPGVQEFAYIMEAFELLVDIGVSNFEA